MSVAQRPPEPIRDDSWTAQVIRDFIYKPAALHNEWSMFVIVGGEGSGKSLSCASILKACDSSFGVHRTHFDPVPFLKDIANGPERPGIAVMGDESGVGFGKRTWHDREQIEANQALQTARDDNRIIGLTVPRLEDLDSQLEGRIHLLLEAVNKKPEEYVTLKFKVVDPSRDGAGKIYKKYPEYIVNGQEFVPERIRVGMPPAEYVDEYLPKKKKWKSGLFERTIDRYMEEREETEPELSPQMVLEKIESNGIEDYAIKPDRHDPKFDEDLIRVDFGISINDARAVRKLLQREYDAEAYI